MGAVFRDDDHMQQVIRGIIGLMQLSDDELDYDDAKAALGASLQKLSGRAALILAATGAEGCRITRVTIKVPNGSGELGRDSIDSGPERRDPIAWGGSEYFTIGRCTVSYEYECRPTVIAE